MRVQRMEEFFFEPLIKGILDEFQQVAYIISEKIEYEYNDKDYNEYRDYINVTENLNSKQILQILNEFSKKFTDLMEKEKGWERLYREAYNFVYQEMGVKQGCNNTNNQQEEVSCYDMQKINMIIQTLKVNLIQNRFNKSFSYFGVLLTKLGERCIIYFCVLIIWKFICQSQWQSVNRIIDQLNQKKFHQLEKTFAYLQKNDYKLSRIQASKLFETIKSNFESQFYNKYNPLILEQINKEDCDLEQQFIVTDDKDFIINYVIDQKTEINNYVDKKLNELKSRLKYEFQTKLSKQYEELITNLTKNAKLLKQHLQPNLNIEEYFQNTQNDLDLERKLFEIVVCFLQGSNFQENNLINFNKRYIFYQIEKVKVEIHLNNLENAKIKLLDVFIEELIEKLENIEQIQLKFDRFKAQELLLQKELEMKGCQTSCEFCNRKCDLNQGHQSKHECQNGHYLIVNLKEEEQQYSCEEYFLYSRPGENYQAFLKTWDFNEQQNSDQFIKKFRKIWEVNGQEICDKLKKSYYNIQYNKIHFIFILDSSESMNKDWTNIKKGVREFIKNIKEKDQKNTRESWISLILFNKEQTTLIKSKKARDIEEKFKMNFLGGGTNFVKPIKQAIKIIKKDNTSDLFLLLFYTDGKAAIPEQELKKISNFEEAKRKKIQLIACTQNGNSQNKVLSDMINFFSDNTKSADLFTFSKADDLMKFCLQLSILD